MNTGNVQNMNYVQNTQIRKFPAIVRVHLSQKSNQFGIKLTNYG